MIRAANTMCAVLLAASAIYAAAPAEFPDDHAALKLYPSPEELQRRIEDAKRNDPQGWAAARADFDLAIRSAVLLADERL